MANDQRHDGDRREDEGDEALQTPDASDEPRTERPNRPRTTTGVWTSPKFGSAGSGGAELEPGPKRN